MSSLHLHIGLPPNKICAKLDLNQRCQKTDKCFLTSLNEHVQNKVPRPYILVVTQDDRNEIRCFDGLGFNLAKEKEDLKKQAVYKQVHYLCLRGLKDITLVEHAPEDTALAYAPFAYATRLNSKVAAARQKLIDHYLSFDKPAKALELLQLDIGEYGEYIKDVKTLILASQLLSSGNNGIAVDEALSTEYLLKALDIAPSNVEVKKLLAEKSLKSMSPQSTATPQSTNSQLSPSELTERLRSATASSELLAYEPLSPLSEKSPSLSPNPMAAAELERAQSCPPIGQLADTSEREKSAAVRYTRRRSRSAPPDFSGPN